MAFEALTAREQQIILQCMKAVAVLIEDWEMRSRLGVEPAELQVLIGQWPAIGDSIRNSGGFLAINNSLNEICHGLSDREWKGLIDTPPDEVRAVYRNWLRLQSARGGIC